MGATTSQIQSFINTWLPQAQAAGTTLGDSPSTILGQWALESGWGTNATAAANNNVGGLGPGFAYSSPSAFEGAYVSTIENNYPGAVNAGADLSAFVNGLNGGSVGTPYFGTGTSADQYLSTLAGVQQTLANNGVQPSVPAPVTLANAAPAGSTGGAVAAPGSTTGTTAPAAASACSGFTGAFTWTCWQGVITDLAFIGIGVMVFIVAVASGLFGSHGAAAARRPA